MKIGDKYVLERVVGEDNTAITLGSGSVRVFGTPFLIAWMEEASIKCISDSMEDGKTTVGISIDAKHTSATPVGGNVKIESEVTNISENGKIITFKISAYDNCGPIGEAIHERAIITIDRFLDKCYKKL